MLFHLNLINSKNLCSKRNFFSEPRQPAEPAEISHPRLWRQPELGESAAVVGPHRRTKVRFFECFKLQFILAFSSKKVSLFFQICIPYELNYVIHFLNCKIFLKLIIKITGNHNRNSIKSNKSISKRFIQNNFRKLNWNMTRKI